MYSCDDAYEAHLKRAQAGEQPLMSKASTMTWDEVWMHPPEQLVTRELAFYREEFGMVVEDLLAMPHTTPILAEGAALLPECLTADLESVRRAVWVVPTEEFQRREYARREWVKNILRRCSDPEQAWENWMARDAGFARAVAHQAQERVFQLIEVDGSRSIEEHAQVIADHFRLGKCRDDGRRSSSRRSPAP